jgi:hypothetical protein
MTKTMIEISLVARCTSLWIDEHKAYTSGLTTSPIDRTTTHDRLIQEPTRRSKRNLPRSYKVLRMETDEAERHESHHLYKHRVQDCGQ